MAAVSGKLLPRKPPRHIANVPVPRADSDNPIPSCPQTQPLPPQETL